ncbi:MAG TPA: MGMT family protein [Vicinamibacterales bacterium]|jgi:methylated-DNA-[protein]-cysteine S-methyltransferase|nr:MGMT family protein [Vicinamibacterales bacterium]
MTTSTPAQTHGRSLASFRARVLAAVRRIPRGRVATYGDIAELVGAPGAARAVGNVMRGCGDPSVPCHRVIAAAGALGGYGGYLDRKRQLLRAEGLEVTPTRIRGFAEVRWPVQPGTAGRGKATRPHRAPV